MPTYYSLSSDFNQCATCEYWRAQRTAKAGIFGQRIEVDDAHDEGECGNERSLFHRQMHPGSSGCSKWQKWSIL